MAIKPFLNEQEKVTVNNHEFDLVKLRDIEVLNVNELEDVIRLYEQKGVKTGVFEGYQRYAKVLNELKEFGYFTYEEYRLKKYFKMSFYYVTLKKF